MLNCHYLCSWVLCVGCPGCSTGIGRDSAIDLAKHGFVVYAGVRKDKDADSLRSLNIPNLVPVILDVTNQETIDRYLVWWALWRSLRRTKSCSGTLLVVELATVETYYSLHVLFRVVCLDPVSHRSSYEAIVADMDERKIQLGGVVNNVSRFNHYHTINQSWGCGTSLFHHGALRYITLFICCCCCWWWWAATYPLGGHLRGDPL